MNDVTQAQVSPNDLKEFEEDLEHLVNLTATLEASKDALNERAKELAEKYQESETLGVKSASLKKMASIMYKDNLEEEKGKALEVFDILEQLQ